MAKGARARGKRIAFGDGQEIVWDQHSETIFQNNLNVAPPGSEGDKDLEWIPFYRGHRIYNEYDRASNKWIWNYDFRPTPGEIVFNADELKFANSFAESFVVIEPNVPAWKTSAANKRWSLERYSQLAQLLVHDKIMVRQHVYHNSAQMAYSKPIKSPSFRHAMAALSKARLYVGPEGGMHHAAAALGIPAVVIFGSWIPPQVTGYDFHTNLAHGTACGSLSPCPHCADGLNKITLRHVYEAVKEKLSVR